MATAASFIAAARGQIGYREGAGNATKFGQWYGMDRVAWCAIFVSWCASQCGALGSVVPRNSYTPAGADWFKARGQTVRVADARPGDVVYFKFPGISRISHVGIVEANLGGGKIQTIEGNTDAQGSRTGGGVWRKIRATSLVAVVGRPKWSGTTAAAPVSVPVAAPVASAQALQRLVGTPADGHWGPASDRSFGALIDAFKGGRGQVRLVQGLLGVGADGVWGPRSQAALVARCKAIQAFCGVAGDGVWGPASQAAADRVTASVRGR